MSDCLFCKIANKELNTEFLYEDNLVVAFKDIQPLAPVHVLVVPKQHYKNFIDGVPGEVFLAMEQAVKIVAEKTGIDKTGFRVIANTGKDAGQTVQHLHLHVAGGAPLVLSLVANESESQ